MMTTDWKRALVVLGFLLLDSLDVKVCLAEELARLELFCLLYVHASTSTYLGFLKVTSHLTTNPACGHVGNLTCRYKAVHVFVEIDGCAVSVNGHTLFQLYYLAEDIIAQPFKGFL